MAAAEPVTVSNYGITHVTFNYVDDIYHQLDGRYIEHKGYTLKDSREQSFVIDLSVNNTPISQQEAEEEGIHLNSYPAYIASSGFPIANDTVAVQVILGEDQYTINCIPSFSTPTFYYSNDNKVGITILARDEEEYAFFLVTSYDLTNIEPRINFTLTVSEDTIIPLDYKFMPYVNDGGNATVYGEAFNTSNTAYGTNAHAEGYHTSASGNGAHAEGGYTAANGEYAHAEGYTTKASGEYSHAEGGNTIASGSNSHTEGYSTFSAGVNSHAEGGRTTAYGFASHAEGFGDDYYIANLTGSGSTFTSTGQCHENDIIVYDNKVARIIAVEDSTIFLDKELTNYEISGAFAKRYTNGIALGEYSHIEGKGTKAIGENSHASGNHTVAEYDNQTVIGKYNDNQQDTLFEVGNGEAGSPSNAFMVYNDGRAAIATDPIENLDITTKQYVDIKTDKVPNKIEYVTHVNTIEQLPQPFDDGGEEYEDMTTPIRNLPILNYINKIKNPPITMTFSSKYKLNQLRKMAGSIAANKGLQYKNLFAYCMKQGSTSWDSRFFIWTDNTMASSNTYVALGQVIFNNPPEVENEPILIPIFHFKPTASKPMYIYCDNFYDGKGFVIYPKNSEKIIWNASTTNEYITMDTEFIIYPLINSEDENISDATYSFLAQRDTSTYQTTTLFTNTSGNNLKFIGYEKLEETFPDVFSEYSNVTKYNSYWDNSINIGRDGSYSSAELFSFDNLGNPDFGFKSGLIDANSIVTVGINNDLYYLGHDYQYQLWARSNSTGSGVWGAITGDITDQEDLVNYIGNTSYTKTEIDNRFYTKEEINALLAQYLPLTGGTITGNINVTGNYQINSTPVLWDEEE